MRSAMPKRSSTDAGATYLDKPARIAELIAGAKRARERMPSIRRVLLFGSLVRGIPTPRSDADLVIELAEERSDHPRDRIPEVLRAFSPLPCALDLHVYTSRELADSPSPVVLLALREGRDQLAAD